MHVWAVFAREIDPPAPEETLEWMRLSTLAVHDQQDAYERLQWYARRRSIEVYHRILKSGCRVETRQLEHAHRLQNCLAIDMIVAWRIHSLTTLGRETPDVPGMVYFTDSQGKTLTTFTSQTKTPPATPPSLDQAVRLLGKLGGHLDRHHDGEPGSEVLWRSMARLADIEVAYDLYHEVTSSTMILLESPNMPLSYADLWVKISPQGRGAFATPSEGEGVQLVACPTHCYWLCPHLNLSHYP